MSDIEQTHSIYIFRDLSEEIKDPSYFPPLEGKFFEKLLQKHELVDSKEIAIK